MTARASITQLAEENHIARSVALRHLKDAGIPRDPKDKTFNHADASEAIRLRLDEARIIGNRNAGRASQGHSLDDEARRDLNLSKAEEARLRTRRWKLKVEQDEGKLVPRDVVMEVCKDIATRARSAFLSIGPKLAPRLAAMTDEKAIAKLIEDEARLALGALADPFTFANEALQ